MAFNARVKYGTLLIFILFNMDECLVCTYAYIPLVHLHALKLELQTGVSCHVKEGSGTATSNVS